MLTIQQKSNESILLTNGETTVKVKRDNDGKTIVSVDGLEFSFKRLPDRNFAFDAERSVKIRRVKEDDLEEAAGESELFQKRGF